MSTSRLEDFADTYKLARFERTDGILVVTLHTEGGPLEQGTDSNIEWSGMWDDIRRDPDNRVVIITGAGEAFTVSQPPLGGGKGAPRSWDRVWRDGIEMINSVLGIPVPVIAAINGPVLRHPEVPLLSDIVLAAPDTVFGDECHIPQGLVPGDGMHVVMPALMGRVRANYFLLTSSTFGAQEAKDWGLVNEIVAREQLLDRAKDIAYDLLRHSDATLRYTRYLLTHQIKAQLHTLLGAGLAVEGLAALGMDWSWALEGQAAEPPVPRSGRA